MRIAVGGMEGGRDTVVAAVGGGENEQGIEIEWLVSIRGH